MPPLPTLPSAPSSHWQSGNSGEGLKGWGVTDLPEIDEEVVQVERGDVEWGVAGGEGGEGVYSASHAAVAYSDDDSMRCFVCVCVRARAST